MDRRGCRLWSLLAESLEVVDDLGVLAVDHVLVPERRGRGRMPDSKGTVPCRGSCQSPRLMSVSVAESHRWASPLVVKVAGAGTRLPAASV